MTRPMERFAAVIAAVLIMTVTFVPFVTVPPAQAATGAVAPVLA